MNLGASFWPSDLRLIEFDKMNLIRPFELEEVKGVIMEMKENSASNPWFWSYFLQKALAFDPR